MTLLRIRCEVLRHAGYSSQTATVKDAAELISKEAFDLVIVSAFLSEADKRRVLSVAGDTPTLVLQGLAVAPELLAAIETKLSNII
jgi:DNA-binding response OmpR family regulator